MEIESETTVLNLNRSHGE